MVLLVIHVLSTKPKGRLEYLLMWRHNRIHAYGVKIEMEDSPTTEPLGEQE